MVKIADKHEKEWQKLEEEYIARKVKKGEIRLKRTFCKEMFHFGGRNLKEKRGYLEKYLRTFDLSNVKETLIYFKNYLRSLLSFIL